MSSIQTVPVDKSQMEEMKVPQFGGKKTLVSVQPAVPLTDEQIVGMILAEF